MKQSEFFYRDPNAPKPNRPNHIGCAILLEYDGRVLLDHRADSDYWAFIGGGLWVNETLAECVIREVREETGIRLSEEQIAFYKIYDDPSRIASYPDGNILRTIAVVYRARLENEPTLVCSVESRELRFFTREELRSIKVAPTHIPILQDYLAEE